MVKKMNNDVTRRLGVAVCATLTLILMTFVSSNTAYADGVATGAATTAPTPTEAPAPAKVSNPVKIRKVSYKDVKKKTKYRKAILRVGKYGALNHLAKPGKKFRPNKLIREGEFTEILIQLYGSDVVGQNSWSRKIVTQKWATKQLTRVAKELGVTMNWSGGTPKGKVSRGQACKYISDAMSTSARMKPENVR